MHVFLVSGLHYADTFLNLSSHLYVSHTPSRRNLIKRVDKAYRVVPIACTTIGSAMKLYDNTNSTTELSTTLQDLSTFTSAPLKCIWIVYSLY